MHHTLAALIASAEEGAAHEGGGIPPIAWAVGLGALATFLLLVYGITRLNQDR